jgi:hypothetical protein
VPPDFSKQLSRYKKTPPVDPIVKLPIEILLYIFQICPLSDVIRLIRVNRYFYEKLHPLLFETINFHSEKSCKRSIAACSLIIRNPSLGKAVLRFDPAGSHYKRNTDRAEQTSKIQADAIALMPNLTDMNIWGRSILPHHLAEIARRPAPRLRRLTLMQVIPEECMNIVPLLVRAHPLLTELRLWPTLRAEQFSDAAPGFMLDRSDAPQLRSFTGSLPVLGNLLQDSEKKSEVEPITHATIASPILLHEHFEALDVLRVRGSSLRSFQCHVVVANWHAMEVIAKAMPQLEILKLHVLANFKRDRFMGFISQVRLYNSSVVFCFTQLSLAG